MTSQVPGRHRRRLTSQKSAQKSALLLASAGAHGAALARDRRAFMVAVSASLAGVTAAVLVGSLVPLNSTWAADRGPGAAGGPPSASAPWSASSLAVLAGPAVSQSRLPGTGQPPSATRPLGGQGAGQGAGKGGKHRKGGTAGRHGQQPGQQHNQHNQHNQHSGGHHNHPGATGTPRAPGATGTSAGTSTGTSTGDQAASAPLVEVTYYVDREWAGGFQGQVRVVNNGTQPISGWQAVIALPGDRVTWFWNADGFVSHHIMLLRPLSADEVVPAGGTLSLFFTATGSETTPRACAFDGIYCD